MADGEGTLGYSVALVPITSSSLSQVLCLPTPALGWKEKTVAARYSEGVLTCARSRKLSAHVLRVTRSHWDVPVFNGTSNFVSHATIYLLCQPQYSVFYSKHQVSLSWRQPLGLADPFANFNATSPLFIRPRAQTSYFSA